MAISFDCTCYWFMVPVPYSEWYKEESKKRKKNKRKHKRGKK